MNPSGYLSQAAKKYGQENMIVRPGDVVMKDCGTKGILRRVKIVAVDVELVAVSIRKYNYTTHKWDGPGWVLEFSMSYGGQRLKKDGSVLGDKSTAVVLSDFTKDDGTVWQRQRNDRHKTFFNHVALCWEIESAYDHDKREYVC
jgi:hypothetical protein